MNGVACAPSPLVGEGRGEGFAQANGRCFILALRAGPLSPTLPHKGRGLFAASVS